MSSYPNIARQGYSRGSKSEESAFMAMVWPHVGAMERMAVKKVGADDAEDAVQEALALAWKHRGALRASANVGGWLHVVTTRVCINLWRRRDPAEPLEDDLLTSTPDVDPDTADLDVRQAIRELPDELRQVIVLHCYADSSCADIAATLQLTDSAVHARLRHAHSLLRQRLHAR